MEPSIDWRQPQIAISSEGVACFDFFSAVASDVSCAFVCDVLRRNDSISPQPAESLACVDRFTAFAPINEGLIGPVMVEDYRVIVGTAVEIAVFTAGKESDFFE